MGSPIIDSEQTNVPCPGRDCGEKLVRCCFDGCRHAAGLGYLHDPRACVIPPRQHSEKGAGPGHRRHFGAMPEAVR